MLQQAIKKRKFSEYYYRRRVFGLSALDQVRIKEWEDVLLMSEALYGSSSDSDDEIVDMFQEYAAYQIANLESVGAEFYEPLPVIVDQHLLIRMVKESEVQQLFGFRSTEQLTQLFQGLEFPVTFNSNGCVFSGESILLAGLYRLHSVNRFGDDGWNKTFGWLQPRASLAFKLFLNFITSHWSYLVTDNQHFWADKLEGFAESIRVKANSTGYANIAASNCCIFGFIDNTLFETCRPGGGPTVDGGRNDPLLQRSFYNGWKKNHG
jgi:hypothetical protein